MQYSTNLNMNKPEKADQYNLDHWNQNTDILDSAIQNEINARKLTDTNLQNVINDLGSASAKDVGSGNGNLPELSSAINGSADNTPIVADGNGKLKPHASGALGSSAFKDAGNSTDNVPINASSLGNTNNAVVVTDANGKIKPYGKTAPALATYGCYITDDTESLSETEYTYSVLLDGFVAEVGSVLKLTFANALQSENAITSVKLTAGGQTGKIVASRPGISSSENAYETPNIGKVMSHLFAGGNYSNNYPNKVWDKFTTLEVMWTGTYWLVMGDAVLCSYMGTDRGYTVYANGLIKQWGNLSGTITLSVSYTSSNSYRCSGSRQGGTYADTSVSIYKVSEKQIRNDTVNMGQIDFMSVGY